ncbi:hypothetical protein Misp06_02934 [Microbulbifer sp. NBRC 101763]
MGAEKREELKSKEVEWHIAEKRSRLKHRPGRAELRMVEKIKAQIRAKVEHLFRYIKNIFGYGKVRYRGLEKKRSALVPLGRLHQFVNWEEISADLGAVYPKSAKCRLLGNKNGGKYAWKPEFRLKDRRFLIL